MASPEDYYHTIAMFDGPWYECDGPSKVEALNLIKTHSKIKNKYIPDWVIEKNLDDTIKSYGGLGSWRGFHTFTLSDIIENCDKWYIQSLHAIKVLSKSILVKWVNHILYRYPDKNSNEKIGLRVNFHKESFNNLSNTN